MNTLELLNFGSCELKKKEITTPRLDSEILLSNVLKKKREQILVKLNQSIKKKDISAFYKLIKRRAAKEPVAYIIKKKEFWSKNFKVNKNTLIPRPETELLVQNLIKTYKDKKISMLDVGTGSGCILISLVSELPFSRGIGIDISTQAIKVAKENASLHKVKNKVKFFNKSIINLYNLKFDLLVSNPPYIERKNIKNLDDGIKNYEPLIALNGGNDGLDVIKKVIYKAKEILKINGRLAIEIGNGQSIKVSKELKKNKFIIEKNIDDYYGNTRCLISKLIK